jgi:lipid-binding SYLF domain-containing protein
MICEIQKITQLLEGEKMRNKGKLTTFAAISTLCLFIMACLMGCSTAPKKADQPTFQAEARAATNWFKSKVPGLSTQIDRSSGYIIYPSVAQWGFIYTGGRFGRGIVYRPDGTQIGWAAVNTGSLGLQAGVQGFKMLVVIENEVTMEKFKNNTLSGSVSGIVVVAESGSSGTAKFERGVAVYQGANKGLMAGLNLGLDYMRYEPLEE